MKVEQGFLLEIGEVNPKAKGSLRLRVLKGLVREMAGLIALQVRTMKIAINSLHKAFENRTRLGIMSALAVNDALDFNSLKEYLDVTDGNLASHLKAFEKEAFIDVKKTFVGRRPNTSYFMTAEGRKAFFDHLKALEKLIKGVAE